MPQTAAPLEKKQSINRKRSDSTGSKKRHTFFQFLLQELAADETITPASDAQDVASYEQIVNMCKVPYYLERFMVFGVLSSLNCFLMYFTIYPLKLVIFAVQNVLLLRAQFTFQTERKRRVSLTMPAMIIVCSWALISNLDTNRLYHNIRGQSAIKLYVMIGVLEVADKLLATIGQDALNVLRGTTSYARYLVFYLVVFVYLLAHSVVLSYQTVSLMVAVNSYSNSLLTLILSSQFSEIKAAVFKRFDREGLFQIAISDIVERFQVGILLSIIGVKNAFSSSTPGMVPRSWLSGSLFGTLIGPATSVIGSELIVDWLKHSYILKFNRLRPKIYNTFTRVLQNDLATNQTKVAQRIGLPTEALAVCSIVMIYPCLAQVSWEALVLVFVVLLITKLLLSMILIRWAGSPRAIRPPTKNEHVPGHVSSGHGLVDDSMKAVLLEGLPEKKKDKVTEPIENVSRYRMSSKRIW